MKMIPILIALLINVTSFQEEPTVEVYTVEKENSIEVHARNLNEYAITLELNIVLDNLKSSKRLPFTTAIAAKADVILLELSLVDGTKKWGFTTNYSYYMGSIFADHTDNYAYRLPYRLGTEAVVAQGYNGDFSHSGRIAYSIDFDIPEGTEIYSARSGVVVDLKESFSEGGSTEYFIDKANYVTVAHNDGTFSEYSHLKENGVIVSIGQRIRTGQLLGYSGATGYVTGPHLHFNVKKAVQGGEFITIPTKFKTRKGTITLKEEEGYKAL
tara:strand:+ start:28756 stop:29565 length:810 start_codon:yes stop_codon:yes gene_type:complete